MESTEFDLNGLDRIAEGVAQVLHALSCVFLIILGALHVSPILVGGGMLLWISTLQVDRGGGDWWVLGMAAGAASTSAGLVGLLFGM